MVVNGEESRRLGVGDDERSDEIGDPLCLVEDAAVLKSHSKNAPPTIPAIQANCFTESSFFMERLGAPAPDGADWGSGGGA